MAISCLDFNTIALFSRNIVDLEDFALRVAILGECQHYLGGGVRFGRKREKYLPPPRRYKPRRTAGLI